MSKQLSLFAPPQGPATMAGKKFVSPVVVKRLPDTNEWRVSPRIEALRAQEPNPTLAKLRAMAENKAYYTDSRADARGTAAFMLRHWRKHKQFDARARLVELARRSDDEKPSWGKRLLGVAALAGLGYGAYRARAAAAQKSSRSATDAIYQTLGLSPMPATRGKSWVHYKDGKLARPRPDIPLPTPNRALGIAAAEKYLRSRNQQFDARARLVELARGDYAMRNIGRMAEIAARGETSNAGRSFRAGVVDALAGYSRMSNRTVGAGGPRKYLAKLLRTVRREDLAARL